MLYINYSTLSFFLFNITLLILDMSLLPLYSLSLIDILSTTSSHEFFFPSFINCLCDKLSSSFFILIAFLFEISSCRLLYYYRTKILFKFIYI